MRVARLVREMTHNVLIGTSNPYALITPRLSVVLLRSDAAAPADVAASWQLNLLVASPLPTEAAAHADIAAAGSLSVSLSVFQPATPAAAVRHGCWRIHGRRRRRFGAARPPVRR